MSPRDTGPIVSTPDGEVADGPTEVHAWEFVGELRAEIAEARADAKAARAKARAVTDEMAALKRKEARRDKVIYSGLGVILAGFGTVLKIAFSAGGESAAEKQHLVEHTETRTAVGTLQLVTIPGLRADIAITARDIADVQGELRAISRLGAVRVQGPPPKPLLPAGEP